MHQLEYSLLRNATRAISSFVTMGLIHSNHLIMPSKGITLKIFESPYSRFQTIDVGIDANRIQYSVHFTEQTLGIGYSSKIDLGFMDQYFFGFITM
jgi:hypothetical protein